MAEPVQEIKDKLDIVEFLRSYLALKPAGKNFKASCPFHKEKTPSFMISPDRQSWHCFGCGIGGDVFSFVMKYENIEFVEALKMLAEKAGVELRSISPSSYKEFGIIYDINEKAKEHFKKKLSVSEKGKSYLKERGLKSATIEEFEVGLSGGESDELTRSLVNFGYNVNDLVRAGLSLKSEKGFFVDRFRNRFMFPIHNHFGKIVGFTGRILPAFENADVGKYVNSPETPIFNKSRLLYGFYKTKNSIREKKQAVLVEGQMDFLMAWQDGIANVTATSGTAFTDGHLKVLRRLADTLILYFDSDSAGELAIERSIDLAAASDFDIRIVIPPEDSSDPAETAKLHPGLITKLVKNSQPAMEYYMQKYLKGFEKAGISDRKKNLRIVLSKIKNLASAVERSHWLNTLSSRTGIKEEDLREEIEFITTPASLAKTVEDAEDNIKELLPTDRKSIIAKRLLAIAAGTGEFSIIQSAVEYFPPQYRTLYDSFVNDGGKNSPSIRIDVGKENIQFENIDGEIQALINNLTREVRREKLLSASEEIRKMEQEGNEEGLHAALLKFDLLSKEMHNQ